MTKSLFRLLFSATVFLVLALPFPAQDKQTFTLTAARVQNGKAIELDKAGWKYHAGDDLNWALPQFDDSSWETLADSALPIEKLPEAGWNGIGWFRLRVEVAPEAANEQLALIMRHWGASELYLDGRMIYRFGTVSASAETEQAFNPNGAPVGISFGASGTHLIAVRHSATVFRDPFSYWTQWLAKNERNPVVRQPFGAGFKMSLEPPASFLKQDASPLLDTETRFFRMGAVSTLGLLYLLLFFFYPRRKAAMFFGLFALALSVNTFTNFLVIGSHYDLTTIVFAGIAGLMGWVSANLFLPVFLYSAFSFRIPKHYWIAVATGLTTIFLLIFFPDYENFGEKLLGATLGIVAVELLRVTVSALWSKKESAWIIGIGVMLYLPLLLYWALSNLGITTLPEIILLRFRQLGAIGIVIAISVYLARQFAATNKNLEAKLAEVEEYSRKEIEHEKEKARLLLVEAENERRAKELEEARALQLSMLPKKLPQLPNLEIAAYMKPATEVGGDYYDFHVDGDGTLTVAVGDATGHGLKAGSVVTATKSLFNALASQPSIPNIFRQSNLALKKMNLRGLFMAMSMLKMKNGRFQVSIAGMPPVLIYRAATGQIEEVAIRATPLGSFVKTVYEQQDFVAGPGDTILMMSDGFPEIFNDRQEMLDYEQAKKAFAEIAAEPAQEIISRFVEIGEKWANGKSPDDDVTFVVLKIGNGNLN